MPIQWGPTVKKLAEVGIDDCEFCHELAPFTVYEQSFQIRFMFLVPLANLNSKKFLVCERCKHSWELSEARALGLIAESKLMPGHEVAAALNNAFDGEVQAWVKRGDFKGQLKSVPDVVADASMKLKERFRASDVDFMAAKYLELCRKDLGAE